MNLLPPPRIYLAGPAQHSWCSWLEGQHVLESFANNLGGDPEFTKSGAPRSGVNDDADNGNLARYRDTYASMMLDSGVYSNMTAERRGKGPVVTIEGYMRFAVRHGEFYDFCASFDDITGGPDANRRNWMKCRDAGIPRLMPVFHQGEPISLLREYVAGADYIGLGFQRPIQNEAAFLDAAFAEIPDGKWVHIFAGVSYLRWPARSADATTWMHEVLAMERESGQGKSALSFLTKKELTDIVVKKYQRMGRHDKWRGVFGPAAGRGEQIHFDEALAEAS